MLHIKHASINKAFILTILSN